MISHLLDPVLEHAPAYDPALTTLCLEGLGAPWWDVAAEAQEILWQLRVCHSDRPRWLVRLGVDLGQWTRWKAKEEAYAEGKGRDWLEVAQGMGLR